MSSINNPDLVPRQSINIETLNATSVPTGDDGVDKGLLGVISPGPQQSQSELRQLEHGADVEIDSEASAVEVIVAGADIGFDTVEVYSEVSVEADLEASAETFGAAAESQSQLELQPQRQEQLQSQSLKRYQNQELEDSLGHHTNNELVPDPSHLQLSDPQNNSKRTRIQYSIDKKIKIIDYKHSNPGASATKIAQDFRMARTTVVGILNNEKKLSDYRSANPYQVPDAHRVVDSRTPEVERLLVVWLRELKIQGASVSDKKIRAQAIEIHRMLSNDLDGFQRRDGVLYTESWLKGFKKRQALSLALKSVYPTGRAQASWATLVQQSNLGSLDPNDIYICDLANIFMKIKPAGESSEPRCATQIKGDASASVLLCCNGTGSDKLPPHIFFRGASINPNERGPGGMDLNTRLGDLTSNTFGQWLLKLSSRANRRICVLVNSSMWRHLSGVECPEHIKIISVPDEISRFLPMCARLITEFKAYYHTPQLLDSSDIETNLIDTYTPLLLHIHIAWSQVQSSVIKESFDQFRVDSSIPKRTSPEWATQDTVDKDDSTKAGAQLDLKNAILDDRFDYYKYQDSDTGPSSDLWAEIQTIKIQRGESDCYISLPNI